METNSFELRSINYVAARTAKQVQKNRVRNAISKVFPFFETICVFRGVLYMLIIVLLIRMFVHFTLEFLYNFGNLGHYELFTCIRGPSSGHSIYSLAFICSPIFGILADKYISRHKIMSFGMFTLFAASVAFILFFLTTHHKNQKEECQALESVFSFILLFYIIGLSAILPLLLPIGIDQMEGASEQSLKSYFAWYFGALNAGAFVSYSYFVGFTDVRGIGLYKVDTHNNPDVIFILLGGLLSSSLSMFVAILLYKFLVNSKRLVVYLPTGNPVGLIWDVTRDALGKYSQRRRRPSITRRIQYLEGSQQLLDLAKDDVENSFEHVESVKTFYRIMPLLLALIPYFAVSSISTGAYIEQNIYLFDQFEDATVIPQLIDPLIILVLVLVFELSPVKKRVRFSSILRRVYIGVLFAFASLIFATIVAFLATYADSFRIPAHTFTNITRAEDEKEKVKIFFFKIILQSPQFLLMGISEFLAVIGTFEFIYAQSPREMKCFIYGLFQCIRGLGFLTPFLFNEILQSTTCDCQTCSCHTCAAYHYQCSGTPTKVCYTYLAGTILFTVYVVALGYCFRKYKKRVRQPREIWYT